MRIVPRILNMLSNYSGVLKQSAAGFSAALSVFIAGNCMGWTSPALEKILDGQTNLKISSEEISWFVALMDFGNILSPIPSGYLADCLGRKITLLLTAFLYFGTWTLVFFGTSAWYLYIARIGAGIGKGMAVTVVPMYLGEIAGVQVRGAMSTIFASMLCSGALFEYCIGPFVSYEHLSLISIILPISFFCTFIFLPESPYYLLMQNREVHAKASLEWFRDKEKSSEMLMKELEEMKETVQKEMEEKGSFIDLFTKPGNRRAFIVVTFLAAFQRFGGISSILAYTVVTLPKTGGYFQPDVYMIIFSFTMFIGNFICAPLMDTLGRKPLLLFSSTFCAFFTGISALFYWAAGLKNNLEGYNWVPYLGLIGYGVAHALGIGVIPSTFVGELFPSNVKSYAASTVAIILGTTSFPINICYLFVKDTYGIHCMFGFFTVCSIISVFFSAFMVFETRGKTFSEIQQELKNNKLTWSHKNVKL